MTPLWTDSASTLPSPRPVLMCLALAASVALWCGTGAIASQPTSGVRGATLRRTTVVDVGQRVDVNRVSMVVTNTGSIAWDKITGSAGFEFPKGTGNTVVFAAGPWFGASVNGGVRLAVSEYDDEFAPGPAHGGLPTDPTLPEHKVYKLSRTYASVADRDAALADYEAGAEPNGAPDVEVQPDGTLNILGDQMLWAVYNDLNPSNHHNSVAGTLPLEIEVRQTVYAFDRPDALGQSVFVRYQVANVGESRLQDFRFGLWCDPDLGGFIDDLVGCDSTRGLGYCYNGTNSDLVYGANPPAVGVDLLEAVAQSGQFSRASAFMKYISAAGSIGGPHFAAETFNYLRGLDSLGNAITNPVTGTPTHFMVTGDPVAGTGWLDSPPSDQRMLSAAGPFDLLPGDSLDATVAFVVSQGSDRLASVTRLGVDDDLVQAFFDGTLPPPPPCSVSVALDFTPNTINLRSMGNWVNARIEPPSPYTPADIDVASIRLNGVVPVDLSKPAKIGDENNNGKADLLVKFDRAAAMATLVEGPAVPVTVTGDIGDSCQFTGVELVRVKHATVTAPTAGAIVALGLPTTVRWNAPNVTPRWVAVLSSIDDGVTWNLVADHLPSTGEYEWHVPYASTPRARVAVVLVERELSQDEVDGVLGISERFVIGSPTDVGPVSLGLALDGAVPQPGRGTLRLSFTLPDAGSATIELYDTAGRRLWARDVGNLGPGRHAVVAGEGAALPAGVYLVRLTRAGQALGTRAVLVR